MSWIQENKFAAMLGGATLLGAIVIGYFGMTYRSKYSEALQQYQDAATQVDEFENLPLYPSAEHRAGKTKALNAYRENITGLQKTFDKYRPKELPNIAPQAFTDQAKAAKEEVLTAFGDKVKLPENFFLSFEAYTAALAREEATGTLSYQLASIKELLVDLAKAGPTEVQNFHRPKSPEEDGGKWEPGPNDTARAFPLEITFKGTEKSVRTFISALVNSPNYYYSIRTLRVTNEKHGKAPNKNDARFETATPAGGAAKPAPDPFGGGFVLPEETPAPPPPKPATPGTTPAPAPGTPPTAPPKPATPAPATPATPAPATPAAPAAPAAAKVDSSRILQPILGDEELQVFLRVDVMQFLPVKELPAVPK